MIKKAQIKFIALIMSILFAVFLVIFGVSFFVLTNVSEKSIERSLDEAKRTFLSSETTDIVPNNSIIAVLPPTTTTTNNYVLFFDQIIFSENTAKDIVDSALSHSFSSGSIGNIYYKIFSEQTLTLLVASDMSETIKVLNTNFLNISASLTIIFLVLFYIVWRLSFNVFQPIRESFYKQKQFISNASHELKTPLTIISANADILNNEIDSPSVTSIKFQTKRLDVLVADMLTLAKMDEQSITLSSVLFNLSEEIINDTLPFDAVAYEKGKTLDIEVEPDINYKGDLQSVKKITSILLDNAVKHANTGGHIVVSLKKENNKIIFAVSNSGSDVPDHQSDKVFERFYRADTSRSRASGGSGLGLSIAKAIADANKWKISAKSVLNESMTITIVMPIK